MVIALSTTSFAKFKFEFRYWIFKSNHCDWISAELTRLMVIALFITSFAKFKFEFRYWIFKSKYWIFKHLDIIILTVFPLTRLMVIALSTTTSFAKLGIFLANAGSTGDIVVMFWGI